MARPLRIEYPGAVYHVTSRGNARKKIFLGEEGFTEKFKDLLAQKEEIKEIPKTQRYVDRPAIASIFKEKILDKQIRDTRIYKAHIKYGYTLKEIADYLKVHYTTVSKAIKSAEGKN